MALEGMDARSTYAERGCVYLERLAPLQVCQSFTYQAQVGTSKKHGPALANPNVSQKPTFELYSYGWPVLLGLHWGMTASIEAVAGVRLLPTYAYFRTYQKGDICKVHIDRPSCEHSLSLAIGYSDLLPWALCVGRRTWTLEEMKPNPLAMGFGDESFDAFPLQVGDGVLYKGIDYRHGRVDPNPNRWSTHLFLHWVDRDGPHAEWAFDRQKVAAEGDFSFPN